MKIFLWMRWLLVSTIFVILVGCGGGGDAPADGLEQVNQPSDLNGVLSNISGLQYKTTSGIKGITDDSGHFQYKQGDEIEFYASALFIGKTHAKPEVFISDFNNSDDVAQALYSLDIDKNPDNGIDVSYLSQKENLSTVDTQGLQRKVATQPIINLQEITYNAEMLEKYKDFLKKNGAMILSKEKIDQIEAKRKLLSLVPKINDLVENKVQTKKPIRRIMFGTQVEQELSILFDPAFKDSLGAKKLLNDSLRTTKDSYLYRAKAAALYGLNMSLLDSVLKKSYSNLEADKQREAYRHQIVSGIEYAFNLVDEYSNVINKPGFDQLIESLDQLTLSSAKFAYDVTAPQSERSAAMDATVGLLADIGSKCIDRKGLKKDINKFKECAFSMYKNASAPLLKAVIDDPLYDSAIDGETALIADFADAITSPPGEREKKFVQLVTKNIVNLGFAAAQLQMLIEDQQELNSLIVAKELYMMVQAVSSPYEKFDFTNLLTRDADTQSTQILSKVSNFFGLGELQTYNIVTGDFSPFILIQNLSRKIYDKHGITRGNEGGINTDSIIGYLESFDKMYNRLYTNIYNHYAKYKDLNTKNDKYAYFLKNLHFKITRVLLGCSSTSSCKVYVHFGYDTKDLGTVIKPQSYKITVIAGDGQKPAVKTEEIGSNNAIASRKFTAVIPIEISPNVNANEVPIFIRSELNFIPRVQLATYDDGSDLPTSIRDEKVYIASVRMPEKSHAYIDAQVLASDSNKYLITAKVEDNRLGIDSQGQGYIYEWKVGCATKKAVESTQEPEYIYTADPECKDKSIYAKVNVYDSFDEQAINSPLVSAITKLDKVSLNDDIDIVLPLSPVIEDGRLVYVAPIIRGGKPPYNIQIKTDKGIVAVGKDIYKASNKTGGILDTSIVVDVTDSNGQKESRSFETTILPKKNKKGYVRFVKDQDKPSDGSIAWKDFIKTWAIKNDTDYLLQDAYIVYNRGKSSSTLQHESTLQVGNIAPGETKTISLPIAMPLFLEKTVHYGYFELWYKENGVTKRMKYPNGKEAYLTYLVKTLPNTQGQQIKIENFTISNIKEDAQNQYFLAKATLSSKVSTLKIESDAGNSYLLVSGGVVLPKPNFIDSIKYNGQTNEWHILFHIRKTGSTQHKRFTLTVMSMDGSADSTETEFSVNASTSLLNLIESYELLDLNETSTKQNFQIKLSFSRAPERFTLVSDSGNRYVFTIKDGFVEYRLNNTIVLPESLSQLTPFDRVEYSRDYRNWTMIFHVNKTDTIQHKTFTLQVQDTQNYTEEATRSFGISQLSPPSAAISLHNIAITPITKGDPSTQTYRLSFDLSEAPKNITLLTEQGNRYNLVTDGVVNNSISFIDDIVPTPDKKSWLIQFHIAKTNSSQSKRFTITIEDANGNKAYDSIDFQVPKLETVTPIKILAMFVKPFYVTQKTQTFEFFFAASKSLYNVTLATDTGNTYRFVRNGKINVTYPFTLISNDTEMTSMQIDVTIAKTTYVQHKSFTLTVEDANGTKATDTVYFDVDSL